MPKVTDEYLADKRNYILECTGEILKEKPMYLITMRDIIKKAGFSQGIIYRYYSGLDEIYVDYINRYTPCDLLGQKIDDLLSSEQEANDILSQCFVAMGEYIEQLLKSVVGITFFELLLLYSGDLERRTAVFPNLRFKQSLEYAQYKIAAFAMLNVEKGVFQPQIPVSSLLLFVSAFIDGIAQCVVFNTVTGETQKTESEINVPEMFHTLAKAIINFL